MLRVRYIYFTLFFISSEGAPIYLEAFDVPENEDFVEEIQVFVSGTGEVERMEIIGDSENRPEEMYDEMSDEPPPEQSNIFTEIYSNQIRSEDPNPEVSKEKDLNLTIHKNSSSQVQTIKSITAGGKLISELGNCAFYCRQFKVFSTIFAENILTFRLHFYL